MSCDGKYATMAGTTHRLTKPPPPIEARPEAIFRTAITSATARHDRFNSDSLPSVWGPPQ